MGNKQLIAMGIALMCSTTVFASATDIVVTGVIKPGACTPSLSGGGTFDFGDISVDQLHRDRQTQFISPPQQLSVNCKSPTRFALRGVDGRAGSADSAAGTIIAFGLGMNEHGQRIGAYFLRTNASSYVVDGSTSVTRLITADSGTSWQRDYTPDYSYLYNGAVGRFHGFAVGAAVPTAIRNLTADLQIDMNIAALRNLTVTDDVKIDGASTIELSYL
ncbi:TPA: DUF1120 domain-containing protein [Pseudomonas putida]|nr:DUF1120 domain-containing protein [Pseudomonas putida]